MSCEDVLRAFPFVLHHGAADLTSRTQLDGCSRSARGARRSLVAKRPRGTPP